MTNGGRQAIVVGVALVALMAAGGCGRDQGEGSRAEKAAEYAKDLQAKVTLNATMAHLQKLQEIADANGGTRVAGSPGYDASVEYVAKRCATRDSMSGRPSSIWHSSPLARNR